MLRMNMATHLLQRRRVDTAAPSGSHQPPKLAMPYRAWRCRDSARFDPCARAEIGVGQTGARQGPTGECPIRETAQVWPELRPFSMSAVMCHPVRFHNLPCSHQDDEDPRHSDCVWVRAGLPLLSTLPHGMCLSKMPRYLSDPINPGRLWEGMWPSKTHAASAGD